MTMYISSPYKEYKCFPQLMMHVTFRTNNAMLRFVKSVESSNIIYEMITIIAIGVLLADSGFAKKVT